MTFDESPEGTGTDPAGELDSPAADGEPAARRPRPGPVSATSRARRVAAAPVEPGLRRPSPAPTPARESLDAPAPAASRAAATAAPVTQLPAESAAAAGDRTGTATDPAYRTGAASPADTVPGARPSWRSADRTNGARRGAPVWLAAVLLALVLALGGTSIWLTGYSARSGSVGTRDQALAAAKSAVPLILSYNYKDFDAGLGRAQAQLTGRAKSDYVTAMTKTVKPAATKSAAVVQAQTDGAGVESVSPDGKQVTVIVFGEQKVTNTALTQPRTDPFRARATLDLVGGKWLVSKFNQI